MALQPSSAMYTINKQILQIPTSLNYSKSRFHKVFHLVFSTIFLEPGSQQTKNQQETEHLSDTNEDNSETPSLFASIHQTKMSLEANGKDLAVMIASLREDSTLWLPGKEHAKKINPETAATLADFCKL